MVLIQASVIGVLIVGWLVPGYAWHPNWYEYLRRFAFWKKNPVRESPFIHAP